MAKLRLHLWVLLVGLFLFAACDDDDDNPVNQDEGDHIEANGVLLIHGEDSLYVKSGNEEDIQGSLMFEANVQSDHIEVQFYNLEEDSWFSHHHEEEGEEEEEEEEHELMVEEVDNDILEITLEDHHWEFILLPESAGTTWIRVQILHNGHADYISPRLPIVIQQP